jgi:HK97 family phage prohead protease
VITREVPFQASLLGAREVRVRASTEDLGRDGLVVVTQGIDIGPYYRNPVVLWQHRPETPVAKATRISLANGTLDADVEFAPEGVSRTADEVCGLVKSGIISGLSVGFEPTESVPIDPGRRHGPQRVLRCELLEISFVSIPANAKTLVTQRTKGSRVPAWYLENAERSLDWGHRSLAAQGLQGQAARMAKANAMRFPGAAPAFGGGGLYRPSSPRELEEARRAHQEAVTEASLARHTGVPMARAARQREAEALRGK